MDILAKRMMKIAKEIMVSREYSVFLADLAEAGLISWEEIARAYIEYQVILTGN